MGNQRLRERAIANAERWAIDEDPKFLAWVREDLRAQGTPSLSKLRKVVLLLWREINQELERR